MHYLLLFDSKCCKYTSVLCYIYIACLVGNNFTLISVKAATRNTCYRYIRNELSMPQHLNIQHMVILIKYTDSFYCPSYVAGFEKHSLMKPHVLLAHINMHVLSTLYAPLSFIIQKEV